MRYSVLRCAVTCCCVAFAQMAIAAEKDAQGVALFNGKDLAGWEHFLVDAKVKKEQVWSVKDGVLVCQGKPGGYLRTTKKYQNFKLVVEWRWAEKPGNSGVLMRITGKPTMLPNCMEAQLASGSAGDMYGFQGFKVGGDKSRFSANPKAVGGLTNLKKITGNEKKPGEWNRYDITVKGDSVTLLVNGKKVNQASGCTVRPGYIGLQSEGGVIHFRNVHITPLK